MHTKLLSLAAVFAASASLSASATALDTSVFSKSVEISVGSGKYSGSALADFPVLVRLDRASGFRLADFSDPAAELRFADANGDSLDFEIDTWDSELGALVWVSVPSLDSSTTITAYFAPQSGASLPAVSSTAVWTKAGYAGVWHLSTLSNGAFADSTGNGRSAVPTSASNAATATGAIGNGSYSTGANGNGALVLSADKVSDISADIGNGSALTLESWIYPESNGRMFAVGSSWNSGMNIGINVDGQKYFHVYYDTKIQTGRNKTWASMSPALDGTGSWRHFTAVYDPDGNAADYINGANQISAAATPPSQMPNGLGLTSFLNGNTPLKGTCDEMRILVGTVSADWAAANYATQADAAFFDYGAVVSAGAAVEGGETVTASGVAWTAANLATSFAVADSVEDSLAVSLTLTPADGTAYTLGNAGTVSAADGSVSVQVDDLLPGTAYTAVFSVTHDGNTVYSQTGSFTTAALPAPAVSGIGDTTATATLAATLSGASYSGGAVSAVFAPARGTPATVAATFASGVWTAVATGLETDTDYPVHFVVAPDGAAEIETPSASFATTGTVTVDSSMFRGKMEITVSGYAGSETLAFFPVLVRIPAETAALVKNPADLRFADAGGTLLAHEVDTWDAAGESTVWVSLRSLPAGGTTFTMYWKPNANAPSAPNPARVWSKAGYLGVWHFNAPESGTAYEDATGGGHDAAPYNAVSVAEYAGVVGNAIKPATGGIFVADSVAWADALGHVSAEAWIHRNGDTGNGYLFSSGSGWNSGASFGLQGYIYGNGGYGSQYNHVPSGAWTHLAINWSCDTPAQFWIDGAAAYASGTTKAAGGTNGDGTGYLYHNLAGGTSGDGNKDFSLFSLCSGVNRGSSFTGYMDEFRVRAGNASAAWAKAVYDTSAPGSSFLTYGEPVSTSLATAVFFY